MKKKHWIKIAIFAALTALILLFASSLLCVANEKDAVGLYGFFLEPEDSIDVVLIGSSSIYTGFYSPLAYEQQGFTSYALSTSTMTAPLYRYAAELAIEKQHPQLLIFETWSFTYEDQQDETSLRKFLDALPDSELKQRAIREIVPEELQTSFRNPFEKYHSSWDRFGELLQVMQDKLQMKRQGYSVTKNFGTTPFRQPYLQRTTDYEVSESGFYYLQVLLDYLKEAEIENVLFIRCPDMVQYVGTDSYKRMIEMIRDAGFDFVNLSAAVEDIGVDIGHDYYNTTHFNVFGAEKFTTFLADYMMKRYRLRTDHDPAVLEEWDQCASRNQQILGYLEELTEQDANGFLYTQRDFLEPAF
ncbi:MAG: hypothetical protein IJ106_01845 [Parasporobacterium sp.]|nr:hypothetical protein [Parasporobacterium sp.]